MNFGESIDYLFGLGYERSVKKFGLENSFILLDALGNPQKNFIKVQVAGTNGKGSTCAFLEAICLEAGIKVGVNTSPHLVSVTERIRINGVDISEEKFAGYVTKVRGVSEKLVESGELEAMPTFFEHLTSIAQLVFLDEKVEVAIVEVGLGGRFDATTATIPEIVAITPIDLDHTKTLGDTIEKIASEKAAVIHSNVKAIIAEQTEKAIGVISKKCEETGIKPRFVKDIEIEAENGHVSFRTLFDQYEECQLGLRGGHQKQNAATAVLLAETLRQSGFDIEKGHIRDGLLNAKHKGRLEYSDGILFDGAHNVSGAKALREYLVEDVHSPITMVFASMRGKDLSEIGDILFPLATNLILTTPENPRAMEAKEIVGFVPKEFNGKNLHIIDDVTAGIETAKEMSSEKQILVTGSLYLIGEVKKFC